MKSPEFNDIIHNSPINTLGLKTKLKTKLLFPLPRISNFQIEYFIFYETRHNVLFE